ncbi:MAG: hypothetical protein ABL903_17535 [Methylococcales bacterium]
MHKAFLAYIQHGRALAAAKKLKWHFALDAEGLAKSGWNLTQLAGATPPPVFYLRDLGAHAKALALLNPEMPGQGPEKPILQKRPLDPDWQDLIKAATCEQLLFKRNSPLHTVNNIIRPLKVIATCCLADNTKPWQVTPEIIDKAAGIGQKLQNSGKLADTIMGVAKNLIDANHLATACPLYPTLLAKRANPGNGHHRSRVGRPKNDLLACLEQRKNQQKLPEQRAFWELVRIVFTEPPRSLTDALRFAALKVMLITGLRIGEAVRLPADWKRTRAYYDPSGKPAGELGGYSSALLLRHFAEKQQISNTDNVALYETTQYVPAMFAEILSDTLDEIVRITQPLRDTLKLQCETGRLFPGYNPADNIPVTELYTRLSGNPFWLKLPDKTADAYVKRYRESFDPAVLKQLEQYQMDAHSSGRIRQFNMAFYVFFNRLANKTQGNEPLALFRHDGKPYREKRFNWAKIHVNIGKLELYQLKNLPTKLSDLNPLKLAQGELQPWEFMFLLPKRALAEERNDGIVDITRYFAVGVPDPNFLQQALGETDHGEGLFRRYGATDDDKSLVLVSHSLRHLQNTELFRLGVADTIITKRFNRRSVAQSYEYDHRNLSERLNEIELPAELEIALGEKSATVAKLIQVGKASGPIVDTFKKIQHEQGDQAAFDYLRVEADGFHATPYGHCINSFTVDPCPKNLECFAGCRHLTATNLPENRHNLEALARKFEAALSEVQARPMRTLGRDNQIAHATIRLDSLRKLLKTPTGQPVFPGGPDLSMQNRPRSVLDD